MSIGANSGDYLVQLGLYSTYREADQSKAQFTLQGFDVFMKQIDKPNRVYQVYMGPYTNLDLAKQQRQLLVHEHVPCVIVQD
jgi:cell division protein FtsN